MVLPFTLSLKTILAAVSIITGLTSTYYFKIDNDNRTNQSLRDLTSCEVDLSPELAVGEFGS